MVAGLDGNRRQLWIFYCEAPRAGGLVSRSRSLLPELADPSTKQGVRHCGPYPLRWGNAHVTKTFKIVFSGMRG